MSALILTGSVSAMAPGTQTYVAAQGGVEPYAYSVIPGGSGGVIDSVTGLYLAPDQENAAQAFDVLQVTDANNDTATLPILIAGPLGLFCDILQKELSLSNGRVYLWDQKIMQPTDSGLYIAVSVLNAKPFASTTRFDSSGSGLIASQSINVLATLSVNALSRNSEALTRKEEILLALASQYSEAQQELNSFYVSRLPAGGQFVNLSIADGAAIPYRFNISVNIQYFIKKAKSVPYFDDFANAGVITEN